MSWFRRRLMMGAGKKELPNYLCFTALESGTFTLTIGSSVTTSDLSYIEYSTNDGETWTKTNNSSSTVTITTPTISVGNSVLWRGSGTRVSVGTNNSNQYSNFTATGQFNISGHVSSLLYGDTKSSYASLSSNYAFTRLFYNNTMLISSVGLELPTTLTQYCFTEMFRGCTNHKTAFTAFNAQSLRAYCMQRIFYQNSNLENAPYIMAIGRTGNYCIAYGFYQCAKVNYIKCLLNGNPAGSTFQNWVTGVASTGIFVKNMDSSWTYSGNSGVPTGWTIIYYDIPDGKYYTDQTKSQECDDHGNPI